MLAMQGLLRRGNDVAQMMQVTVGRILLEAPTIYLALPLVCAHWAIVRGWAEPHYLTSFGLMPAGAVFADGGFAQV